MIYARHIAALCLDHIPEFLPSFAIQQMLSCHDNTLPQRFCLSTLYKHLSCQCQRHIHQVFRQTIIRFNLAVLIHTHSHDIYTLFHLQPIPHRISQRIIHPRHQSSRSYPAQLSRLNHPLRQFQTLLHVIVKTPSSKLHIQHERVWPFGNLLRHDGTRLEREAGDGARYVAKCVHAFVRGAHVLAGRNDCCVQWPTTITTTTIVSIIRW
mmetsp:Transcript_4864/g.9457  ORF Transcript_4864/g.9457 Transcript_4864/m.9457 type:complete len:209 (-) Transcript_4864:846-1472(-)